MDPLNLPEKSRVGMEKEGRAKTARDLHRMKLGADYGIDPTLFESIEAFNAAVDEAEEQKFLEDNYPEGTVLDIDFCSGCNTWTVGEKRCACGNRRVNLVVDRFPDGSVLAYPSAY